ncbi:hypothetical protein [Flammeovirga sp. SJP92]|uniref:hypothetical protein n=1 Tax=Flammeovirga sp. SJP92 TaxID=1775430 RepID=UPI0007885E49|nr:hypothetical protein [Flammeovirga sp. SJP92]KXX67513.1 hypothetical protein AVL50_25950 [Flammeovirga sp. SJP92]
MIQSQFSIEKSYLINDITNIALRNVANALSTVLKDEILVRNVTEVKDLDKKRLLRQDYKEDVFVLTTDIIGDMKAETMLIVHGEDEQSIIESTLPRTEWGKKQMREAMLLELDNILIAAFVTKFANLFNNMIYGHVPSVQEMSLENFDKFIHEREQEMNVSYALKAELGAFKSRVNLELICMFDESLIPFVRNFDIEHAFVGQEEHKKEDKKGFFKSIFG